MARPGSPTSLRVEPMTASAGDALPPSLPATGGALARETLFVALGLAGLFTFMLLLSDGEILLTRPLWVDEVWTVLVSGQSSPADVIASLANGADGGSGLVHLIVWALQQVIGIPSPVVLRTLSLICVFTALCLVYAVLRRRFSNDASIAGMLAVGSHYLVITHAFEARFYGPWLLCCVLVAAALSHHQAAPSRRRAIMVGVAAVLLCAVHFYGVITLGLMVAAVVASYGRRWREAVRVVAPTGAGIVAFLAIVPLAMSVRNAFPVPTWVPDFELRQLRAIAHQFWIARLLLVIGAALVVGIVLSWRKGATRSVATIARHAAQDAGIVALASLALVPLVLVAVTLLGQPSMLPRYSITTALAWGPFVALTMELLGRWPSRIARVVLVVYWFATFVTVTFEKKVFASDVQETEEAIRLGEAQGAPIVFQSVHAWYPVWARDRTRSESLAFLELSDATFRKLFRPGTLNELYNRGLVLDRGIVRVHSRRFGVPTLVSQATLDTTQRFVFIAAWAHLPVGFRSIERFSRSVFPNHRVRQLDLNSALLERVPVVRPPAAR